MSTELAACIDHVVVPADDLEHLFSLFTDGLGLPVAWPVASFGIFESGGITFGNGGLECVRDTGSGNPFFAAPLPVVVRGIALRPMLPLDEIAATLDKRGIPNTGVQPFGSSADGTPLGSMVSLSGLLGDAAMVYFIDYAAGDRMCGGSSRAMLARSDGGIVGATAFAEVQIGVPDLDAATQQWQSLFDPLQTVEGEQACWQIGDGPRIRLKQSPILGVAGIEVTVRDLEHARKQLADVGLLGPSRANGCGVRHPETHGLDVWFSE